MDDNKDSDAFYGRLKEELQKSTSWPSKYLYKFIIPTDPEKISRIESLFDNLGAVIDTKKSSNGKYTSISITVLLDSPDAVIEKYKLVGKIDGVISL